MGKKEEQLGMSKGAANGRLNKMIMFRLVQRLGEDFCFRCEKQIEDISELSIEHKKPWLDVDVALYWDLDNIAFSHLHCNTMEGLKKGWLVSSRAKGFHEERKINPELDQEWRQKISAGMKSDQGDM